MGNRTTYFQQFTEMYTYNSIDILYFWNHEGAVLYFASFGLWISVRLHRKKLQNATTELSLLVKKEIHFLNLKSRFYLNQHVKETIHLVYPRNHGIILSKWFKCDFIKTNAPLYMGWAILVTEKMDVSCQICKNFSGHNFKSDSILQFEIKSYYYNSFYG